MLDNPKKIVKDAAYYREWRAKRAAKVAEPEPQPQQVVTEPVEPVQQAKPEPQPVAAKPENTEQKPVAFQPATSPDKIELHGEPSTSPNSAHDEDLSSKPDITRPPKRLPTRTKG